MLKNTMLAVFVSLLMLGCPAEEQNVKEEIEPQVVTEYRYVCHDGTVVDELSNCPEPEIPECEPQPCYEGEEPPVQEKDRCDREGGVECAETEYCDTEGGRCVEMKPVSIVMSPGKASYGYYRDAVYTGSFSINNGGGTPVRLEARSLSKYVSILSEGDIMLGAGENETIRYRVEFIDEYVPVGGSTLLILVTSPVEGMRANNFQIHVNRETYS